VWAAFDDNYFKTAVTSIELWATFDENPERDSQHFSRTPGDV